MMKRRSHQRLIAVAVFVFASVAHSETKTSSASHPIFSFTQYEPISANLLVTKSVTHDVVMLADSFQIESTWKVEIPEGTNEIIAGSDSGQGAKVGKISVDGVEVRSEPVADNQGYFRVALANFKSKTATLAIASTLPLDGPKDALQLISTYSIPKPARLVKKGDALGWDLRALSRHSYGDPVSTSFKIKLPAGWLAAGSNVLKATTSSTFESEPLVAGRYAVVLADTDYWKFETCSVEGIACLLVSKTKGAALTKDLMQSLLAQVADHFGKQFGKATDHVVMVDSDWDAISGGLLGSNILGFFSKSSISEDEQAGFKESFGWKPQSSTVAYVTELYKSAKDPWRAYMTGMLAHEFAHLYFGFGRTTERIVDLHELWFSLGMGLVYDEIVTKAIAGRQDAFFAAVEENWRTKFAGNKAIDQRLIDPDTSKDKVFKVSRAHEYAHGKALAVLRTLRERIGTDAFDRAVVEYVREECSESTCIKSGSRGGYQVFRPKLLAIAPKLSEYERELGIR